MLSPSHTLCCTQGRVWWRYTVHIVNKFLSAQLQVASIHLYQTLSRVQRRVWLQNYCMCMVTSWKNQGAAAEADAIEDQQLSRCNWGPAAKQIQLGRSSWSRCNWGAVEEPAVIGDPEQQLKCSSRILFSKSISSWVGQWTIHLNHVKVWTETE